MTIEARMIWLWYYQSAEKTPTELLTTLMIEEKKKIYFK